MIYQTPSLGNFDEVKMLTESMDGGLERVGLRSYQFFLLGLIFLGLQNKYASLQMQDKLRNSEP